MYFNIETFLLLMHLNYGNGIELRKAQKMVWYTCIIYKLKIHTMVLHFLWWLREYNRIHQSICGNKASSIMYYFTMRECFCWVTQSQGGSFNSSFINRFQPLILKVFFESLYNTLDIMNNFLWRTLLYAIEIGTLSW